VNAAELRQKAPDDLRREIAAHEREIWKIKFQRGSEKAGDPNKIRTLRREVARMLTILRERELGIERGAAKR
jgi:large subunit ribosomal protein L29